MNFKLTIPKFDYSHDFVRVIFETTKLDVVVDVTPNDMTARGWTNSNEFKYHLKPSDKKIINSWVTKQGHKMELIKSLKNDLEDMNAKIISKLQEVNSMLDEGDDDIKWELENNIKLDYDIEKIEKLLKQNYGN